MRVGFQLGINRKEDIDKVAQFGLSCRRLNIVIVQHVPCHSESIAEPSREEHCEIFLQDHLKDQLSQATPDGWRLNGNGSFVTKDTDTFRIYHQLKSIFPDAILATESFFVHDCVRRENIMKFPWWHKGTQKTGLWG